MTPRQVAGVAAGAVAALAGAFLAGRASVPPRVETRTEVQTRIEWRDREVVRQVAGPVKIQTVTRTVTGPAGPERVVVRTLERGPVTLERATDQQGAEAQQIRTVTIAGEAPRWRLGASYGLRRGAGPIYGLDGSYRLAGPLWIGAAIDAPGVDLAGAAVRGTLAITF